MIHSLFFFIQIFILTIFISLSGNLLKRFLFKSDCELEFEEDGLYGFILIGFISLLINFFLPLNQIYNSIIFTLIFLIGIYLNFFNKFLKKILIKGLIISLLSFFILAYSTVNRPDAWLYHLPYSNIVNDSKIIIGVANIHERFAHISIFQYISSFFNNHIFLSNGILIPISLVVSFFFLYLFQEFNRNFLIKSKTVYSYLCFLFLILGFYAFNRYSEYGNDAQAHFYYLFFITILIKYFLIEKNNDYIKKIFILSSFIFLIKPTFIFIIIIPIFLFFYSQIKIKLFRSRSFLFSTIFVTLWLLKNFLTIGCLIYPLNFTCFNDVSWKAQNLEESALINEAWSKGWPDQKKNEELKKKEYIKNFNWLKTWSNKHLFFIIEKITPFVIFLILNFLIFFFTRSLKKNIFEKKMFFLLIFSFCFLIIWFLKFPVFRHGISQIYLLIILIFYFIYIKNINFNKPKIYFNYFKYFIFIFLFIVLFKNSLRIIDNENNKLIPNIYFAGKKNTDLTKVYNNQNIFTHYETKTGNLCGYSKSPCTHIRRNFLIKNFFGYQIYLIDKN